ncbi:MAG: VanZ family protein [Gammaproteobacteria bacterium]
MMVKFLDSVCLLLYCLFIFWLSDQASLNVPMWFPHQDKIHHAGAYFIMAVFAWRTFRHAFSKPGLITLLFCGLYGISDEWHQSFVDGRYADILDWLADFTGAGLALYLLYKFTSTEKLG